MLRRSARDSGTGGENWMGLAARSRSSRNLRDPYGRLADRGELGARAGPGHLPVRNYRGLLKASRVASIDRRGGFSGNKFAIEETINFTNP